MPKSRSPKPPKQKAKKARYREGTALVQARVSIAMADRLKEIAEAELLSVSDVVRRILARALAEDQPG